MRASARPFWRRMIGRLIKSQNGIAAVEFALIAPVILLAYLGATDLTQALAIDRKLSQVSATVSDLVSQEAEISSDKVQRFFDAGIAIMRPFELERTRLRLTIVEVSENGSSTEVTGADARNWTRDAEIGDSYDLPEGVLPLSSGRYAVVASARYDYQPLFGTVFNGEIGLEQRSFHVTRQELEAFGFNVTGGSGGGGEGSGEGAGEDPEEPEDDSDEETDGEDEDASSPRCSGFYFWGWCWRWW